MLDLTLHTMLHQVKIEAERLLSSDSSLSRQDAYVQALGTVIMISAEEQAVSPFEARIISEMDRITRINGRRVVSVTQLSVELRSNQQPMSRYTLHYHLSKLELRGLVHRPDGPKSGWAVAA